uniref:Uncharacterized protein n=1 Tax=Quercus lobata TaxID=97700 RepID=A0A7N2KVI8_QUELO
MAPTKHATSKRSSSKRACTDFDNFKFSEVNIKYKDYYKRATIIIERVVKLETLEDTFILEEMVQILGGTPKKSSMNTIPFSPEMRTLAYVMIHNLYPVTNLTTLSAPRTMLLYDLFTHKEIDVCEHIFHLLTKSIEKQNSRTVMPFPILIMGLIAKERPKLLSGLTVV